VEKEEYIKNGVVIINVLIVKMAHFFLNILRIAQIVALRLLKKIMIIVHVNFVKKVMFIMKMEMYVIKIVGVIKQNQVSILTINFMIIAKILFVKEIRQLLIVNVLIAQANTIILLKILVINAFVGVKIIKNMNAMIKLENVFALRNIMDIVVNFILKKVMMK
jgi:hypothetical protein